MPLKPTAWILKPLWRFTVRLGGQQFVETGTETAKSLLSVVGGAVAKAAERLSTETVNIEDRKFR